MSRRKRSAQGERSEKGEAPDTFVAVHSEVESALKAWLKSKKHKSVAIKFYNLMKAFINSDSDAIKGFYRQLDVTHIHDCSGLVELGPKQSKGGAARIFVLQEFVAAFFVTAGVEKGSKGVKVDQAKKRAKEVKKLFKGKLSAAREKAIEQLKELGYRIIIRED